MSGAGDYKGMVDYLIMLRLFRMILLSCKRYASSLYKSIFLFRDYRNDVQFLALETIVAAADQEQKTRWFRRSPIAARSLY